VWAGLWSLVAAAPAGSCRAGLWSGNRRHNLIRSCALHSARNGCRDVVVGCPRRRGRIRICDASSGYGVQPRIGPAGASPAIDIVAGGFQAARIPDQITLDSEIGGAAPVPLNVSEVVELAASLTKMTCPLTVPAS
jgi:hypothetical protein